MSDVRTRDEIISARKKITATIAGGGLTSDQLIVLQGMSTALQWVCREGGSTLQRLIDGESVARKEPAR